MKFLKIIFHIVFIILLTILTQVGGLIWILTLIISAKLKWKKAYLFFGLYFVFNLILIPPIAKAFGREKLPTFNSNLTPRNIAYPILFRNYITPQLKTLLIETSNKIKEEHNFKITYLDANFPFFDKFPLLPHLSHNDGKKIDISFMYKTKDGKETNKKPSISGYGAFIKDQSITSTTCQDKGYWQYDFTKYFTFGTFNDLDFDDNQTKILIKELLEHIKTQKIFIEPYLKTQMGLNRYDKIRFHGCRAVRHDDHIHLQIR
ncbi:hypothetical protein UMM65_14645 [Aureibaculum sp. 2210JD6-5]|uniref:hypothetical protein n=1 Tax=Aureibaculum sp. 2210JD6-5 TaxID=3103957 RepID=UPI002AACBB0B|nr:hypothetical protein [Aureibaculum sp. 2210JD6-5]MDY7396487.1 hypothetical protein [Aureibaculum sp. 2210JD6-5]